MTTTLSSKHSLARTLLGTLLALSACDSGGELPDAQTPGGSCETGQKSCAGACVSVDDPLYGCGDTCAAACSAPGATTSCVAGACAIAQCDDASSADCDGDLSNGCEAALETSLLHCGACGNACIAKAGQEALCLGGACAFPCQLGHENCDGDPENGCEARIDASDANNCGACGRSCGAEPCTGGVCQPELVADGIESAAALTGTASHLFVTNGNVWRVDKTSQAAEVLFGAAVTALEVDAAGATLYALDFLTKKVVSIPTSSAPAPPTPLADLAAGIGIGLRVVVGQSVLYYSDLASIHRLPLAGGTPEALTGATHAFDIDDANDDLLAVTGPSNEVTRFSLSGGTPTPLLSLSGTARALDLTGTTLSALISSPAALSSELVVSPLAGPASTLALIGDTTFLNTNGVLMLDTDDDAVYYAVRREQSGFETVSNVYRASKTQPGNPILIMAGIGSAAGVHVDATHVYATDSAGGRILRVPK